MNDYKSDEEQPIINNDTSVDNSNTNTILVCNVCNNLFQTIEDLNEHFILSHSSEINIDPHILYETIEESVYYCPVCQEHFYTDYQINIHFLEEHQNYEQLLSIDKHPINMFPGFALLKKILLNLK